MACGCGNAGCGGPPCGYAPRELQFTVQTPQSYAASLGRKLIKIEDRVRDIDVRLGFRPYNVRLIYTVWTGGAKGFGEESVLSETLILPTPLVLDLGAIEEVVTPVGREAEGGLLVTEISGCYTEDQLLGVQADGTEIPENQNFYYEVEFLHVDGSPPSRRRFSVAGTPEFNANKTTWSIRLDRARPDRLRSGAVR